MKNSLKFAGLATLGGIAAFVLRRLQDLSGFEPDTGLPVRNSLYALALPILLILLAAVFAWMVRKLPADCDGLSMPFSDRFCSRETFPYFLLVSGLLLMGVSGALDIFSGVTYQQAMLNSLSDSSVPGLYSAISSSLSPRLSVIQGIATVCGALCLIPVCRVCRSQGKRRQAAEQPLTLNGNLLLVPVVALVVRLVLTYRADSVNPSLSAYYLELLALMLFILSLFRLSSFAFDGGKTRRYVWDTSLAVVLCIATLADGHSYSYALLYGGAALTDLGFLLLKLDSPLIPAQ